MRNFTRKLMLFKTRSRRSLEYSPFDSNSGQVNVSGDYPHLIPQHLRALELCLVFPECQGEEAAKEVHQKAIPIRAAISWLTQ